MDGVIQGSTDAMEEVKVLSAGVSAKEGAVGDFEGTGESGRDVFAPSDFR